MELSSVMAELFSSPPNLNSSSGQSTQVASRTWPVATSAAAWLISAITCLFPGSVTISSIGYGAGIVATVLAMFAALDQRQRELNANYVRRGLNVATAARTLRSLAFVTSAINIVWLASKVAE